MTSLSVIIPTFNHHKFILQTVKSVLDQDIDALEVIVVNDGSTDGTEQLLKPYLKRIKYFYQENMGESVARNQGFDKSKGDYILFLDSDDLLKPNCLRTQAEFLDNNSEFGLVYCAWDVIDEEGFQVKTAVRPQKEGEVLEDLLLRKLNIITPGVALVRRDCYETVGLFDEELKWGEDVDMWLRIAKAGYLFGYIDQPLMSYRIHRGSQSSDVNVKEVTGRFMRLDKFFSDPNLSDDILRLKPEAYAIMHYSSAARYYRAGKIKLAKAHIGQAIRSSPILVDDDEWLLEWISGFLIEPQSKSASDLFKLVFSNLPAEATTLKSLERRAWGRFHVVAAFEAYQNNQYWKIRDHILPALFGDPYIIKNSGFIKVCIHGVLPI